MPRPPFEVDSESVAAVCERYGIARLDVFGSVARGDADAESDIDVLYVLAPGTHLGWNIENLTDELTAVLGRPVDLVSRNALHQRIRDRVLAEARTLYAA
ncbi:MAG TPA: nucleotidyltransferase family protein [Acidimicrobiales bacterium]|nr:nucleotidyltransferase family protein [Acidimicrobiales bacterium]